MATNRLFFALMPSEEVREACSKAAKDIKVKNQTNGRLINPHSFHLTVLFLGDQMSSQDEAKAIALAQKLNGDPVEFTLNHASSFKDSKVWWLGMGEAPEALIDLRNTVKDAVSAAGIPSDRRRFVPHITILRGTDSLLPQTRIEPITWRSDVLVLIKSRIDLEPRSYEVIAHVSLTGAKRVKNMEQISLL